MPFTADIIQVLLAVGDGRLKPRPFEGDGDATAVDVTRDLIAWADVEGVADFLVVCLMLRQEYGRPAPALTIAGLRELFQQPEKRYVLRVRRGAREVEMAIVTRRLV